MNALNEFGRPTTARRASSPQWLAAAVAMLAAAAPGLAQNQVGGNGHLNDANNGAGTGGYNSASNPSNRTPSGTQVLTNDVTGLNGFHGDSQVTDPNVFQGGNPDAGFDRFNAIAAPVNSAGPSNGTPAYTPYYSKPTYTAAPPANFTTTPNGAAYVPNSTVSQRGNPATPGTVGQVNSLTATQPLYSMSPLYGVREVQAADQPAGTDDANLPATGASPAAGVTPEASSVGVPVGSQRPDAPVAGDPPSPMLTTLRQRFQAAAGPAGASAVATGGGFTAFGNAPPTPSTRPADPVVPAGADQPFVITSLVPGIRAEGLADLLRSAEGQMRAGQFGQAVDTYNSAGERAPTNPFVRLGRGFAELGAGYYGRAEVDLTRAILSEPAVLAAQYDLKGFLGEDRLTFAQKDLADIGATEQTARPFLLLAYIDHNTGADDATVTAKDLDTAEARGANQQVIGLMRAAWNLKVPGRN